MSRPFDGSRGLVVVPVQVFGPSGDVVVHMALDTGATVTMINADLLVLIGYDPAASTKRVQLTTGSGVEFAAEIVVERIEAIGKERRDMPIICHTLPPSATVDGLLGLDLVRDRKLTIDFLLGTVDLD